ncbi:MAG: multicopper oxidase domain-containing protein [Planctomycetota bacterium]
MKDLSGSRWNQAKRFGLKLRWQWRSLERRFNAWIESKPRLQAATLSTWKFLASPLFRRGAFATVAVTLVVAVSGYAYSLRVPGNSHRGSDQPLEIPPLDEGTVIEGTRQFRLVVDESQKQLLPGMATNTAGISGPYLGPTLRMKRGDDVSILVENNLAEMTTMHWHGMHVPAKMDGTPHQEIQPGETWTATFPVEQQAATLWYHPHPHGNTGDQVYQGLAGMIWIDDQNSQALQMPQTYGVDDFPLVIQDRNFNRSNQFRLPGGIGLGTTILVNGTINPSLEVESRQTRFRLLNGSNGRTYHIGFDDEREFLQVGTDGGLLETPLRTQRIILAPGERAELIVDFSDGKEVMLKSFPEAGLLETAEMILWGQGSGNFDLVRLQPTKTPSRILPHVTVETPLCTIDRYQEADAKVTRHIRFGGRERGDRDPISNGGGRPFEDARQRGGGGRGGFAINGQSMDMHRIDERVRLGDTEIWELTNGTGQAHPFHIHLVQFQILDRDGRPPSGADRGWKDTILVHPGDRIRTIMKFDRYSDARTPYMYHCHIMAHEDNGMMGQFLVVEEPDQLALLAGEPTVLIFVYGLDCEHCFEQVTLFDEHLGAAGINLVVITPESEPNAEREKSVACPIVSDPENRWAGWFKMLHDGPAHGTLLIDADENVVWGDTQDTPYMDVDAVIERYRELVSAEAG